MGVFSWLRGDSERFSTWTGADTAFAAWLRGDDIDGSGEIVSPSTVLGLSAVLRSVSVISSTIAGLPLRTYERNGEDRIRVASVFDDPYPGIDGMTPFQWVETVLIHELLWRDAFLWHEDRDATGFVSAYRPIVPEAITKVERVNGRMQFSYEDNGTTKTVGTEMITHIPGPSLDGLRGHPLLSSARAIFSGAISGDKAAQRTLRLGIRLAGIVTPRDGVTISPEDAKTITDELRNRVVGRENAGDIAMINRHVNLDKWTPTNVESQWNETRTMVLGEVGRLFGVPAHLLNDTEKQTSWGTGVAEQNLGLARYTLMGWSSRIEQVLSRRLPKGQFVEFDYKGLLQGTPAQEIDLLISQQEAGILTTDEVRKILNLPSLTPKQRAEIEGKRQPAPPAVRAIPIRQEATA